ncbi:lanthionine synthetase C family protein [Frankia sp. CNm7]|uniref:Lanthionine synthetase C family protein n=1 Tax=Frankia nepalensis TaxID=1836974 RepID=A0A937UN64_9ACTN|nr:lanthionine synthetase C family protein [Frankia nepalensis]MBL7496333.1 lanthionine synthetase C family protein [Frankia nepalensis]MBL7508470.1 lanthionine synthetase C family protein [Frankia nepalensis]MBL7521634.1 lanthionine synthetase C family protein [Frankia nepalensis]MBL7627602.1 lanthionine synthetase C family protein [Frankia nepalensis]
MTTAQSLSSGAVGIALLHLETGNQDAARAALHEAVADGVSIAEGASLYYGAPALAFVLAATDQPGLARAKAATAAGTATVTRRRLQAAHRRIDQRRRPPYAEYDLIRGLTGLGVVARRLDDPGLLREVLTYLVRLTEPIDGLPGWWCPHGPNRTKTGPPGGHGNHGIAHGITGPAALLALALLDGVRVDGQEQALTTICQWLDAWKRPAGAGSWWPEVVTRDDLDRGEPRQRGPARPSWCYGTPGIARAQQLAARALGDTPRQHLAETAFAACIQDPAQRARLTEPGLCHGTAGLLTTARRIAADASNPIALAPLLHLHQDTAAADASPGFLDGASGAELATAGTTTSWDACLLLC